MGVKDNWLLCRLALGVRMTFSWVMSFFDDLFNKHQLMRRLIVVGCLGLIFYSNYKTYNLPGLTSADAVKALITNTALLTPIIAFYKWTRDRDDRLKLENKNDTKNTK